MWSSVICWDDDYVRMAQIACALLRGKQKFEMMPFAVSGQIPQLSTMPGQHLHAVLVNVASSGMNVVPKASHA